MKAFLNERLVLRRAGCSFKGRRAFISYFTQARGTLLRKDVHSTKYGTYAAVDRNIRFL